MQQVVWSNCQKKFFDELQAVLMDGWKVVPHTMFFGSAELVSDGTGPHNRVGETFKKQLFLIVVEREDVR